MAQEKNNVESPLYQQYLDLKQRHPKAILLFRCGDFYETYDQDAQDASQILGITLTRNFKVKGSDGHGLRMAGFPNHALDTYLPKLIRADRRVAICDQLEDPTEVKKLAQRGVTEIISPRPVKTESESTETESTNNNTTEDMTQEQHIKELDSLKQEMHKKLLAMASETIKALGGTLPPALNTYYSEALGKLELIKVKFQCKAKPTDDEMNYLITMAEKGEKAA